ncbi:arsenate reductase (glutaredoxin) [Ottowia sp.]|jgi:arsenate reductase|uniref:arsenate reductase (glutaredoxin) n=1 Tax=Ottowia sp. TaxID=1898956 RepID=UPI0025D17DB2|nr:arsenate reductase (glutaredoxin) [Ottowia sp.]MBK6613864.1 arsenate reductase (glutaredoxin) [Ottowia sp.]MBK6745572.1 arsenate reductase (glutaredoxin) [Ottowia sp.]
MSDITIFHNPQCGTSRSVLALIRASGAEPRIVEYLKTPPSAAELRALARATGEPLRALLRTKQPEVLAQGLDDLALTDGQLAAAMAATPVLIERPIVVAPRGTRLCRPADRVRDLLPRQESGSGPAAI